ncbi:hypothetical protein JHK84_031979 [Glycine max]|nr:hypothetical protein JHK84_031979 [Glycine max]
MAITTETQPQPQQHKYSSRVNCNNPKLCINFDVKLKYKVIFDIPIFCASMDTLMTRQYVASLARALIYCYGKHSWKSKLMGAGRLDKQANGLHLHSNRNQIGKT